MAAEAANAKFGAPEAPSQATASEFDEPFDGKPYLQCLDGLKHSFPALKSFLEKLANTEDNGRAVVQKHYMTAHKRGPGRCYCLVFEGVRVSVLEEYPDGFGNPDELRKYLTANPARESRDAQKRRLFILEDMEPDYVDALGHHLGVDPLVFSEQMNTWNYTDSWSIPHRELPSMATPEQSFTMRYYELRTLHIPQSIDTLTLQMTFAVNRRRYERWRDVDVPSAGKPDRRHGFVRRSASFWTSQVPLEDGVETKDAPGWDAVIMVDPGMAAACKTAPVSSANGILPPEKATSATNAATAGATGVSPNSSPVDSIDARDRIAVVLDSSTPKRPRMSLRRPQSTGGAAAQLIDPAPQKTLILQDARRYKDRASLWQAQDWAPNGSRILLREKEHESWPYHDGCSTLAPLLLAQLRVGELEQDARHLMTKRDLVSPLDEMVFYWTNVAPKSLIEATCTQSSNATFYLLKHIAQHWVHQLELINTTVAKGEWFSDDYQAKIDDNLSLQKWKADLRDINGIAKDINYMRRHLNHFWRSMILNLERLGVQLGSEAVDETAPLALRGAQKDFLTIHTRMAPLRERAEALNSVANDLANLRAAFRGVHDSEFGLRLSLFASVIFPLTLVASIFSMSDDYLPGSHEFWKLWAIGPPFCIAVALLLVYGDRPWKLFIDVFEYAYLFLRRRGYLLSDYEREQWRKKKELDARMRVERRTDRATAKAEKLISKAKSGTKDEEKAVGALGKGRPT